MKKIFIVIIVALLCSSLKPHMGGHNMSDDQIKQKKISERARLPQVTLIEKWKMAKRQVANRTFAPSLVRLQDGRYRMYSNALGFAGIESYISDDGLNFTKESGLRLTGTGKTGDPNCSVSHPWVVPDSQGYRLYYQANAVCNWQGDNQAKSEPEFRIMSASSIDGLTFTHDEGIRVDRSAELVQVAHGRIIKLPNGTLRMYFSANSRPRSASDIMGASSQDGMTWTLDAELTVKTAHDPTVISQDGKIIMYTAYDMFNILKLTSDDGVKFTPAAWLEFQDEIGTTLQHLSDIEIAPSPNGTPRIYGSWKGSSGLGAFEKE